MDYYNFKSKMYDLCDKNSQNYPTDNDIKYFYNKYDITYKLITDKQDALKMRRFAAFSNKQRLLYRHQLAEMGIELTPIQVIYYIYMITIILKDKYNIDT